MENGNLDRYLNLVNDSLKRIENKLDKVTDDHDDRITGLELHKAEQAGEQKARARTNGIMSAGISLVVSVVAAIGGSLLGPRY